MINREKHETGIGDPEDGLEHPHVPMPPAVMLSSQTLPDPLVPDDTRKPHSYGPDQMLVEQDSSPVARTFCKLLGSIAGGGSTGNPCQEQVSASTENLLSFPGCNLIATKSDSSHLIPPWSTSHSIKTEFTAHSSAHTEDFPSWLFLKPP